MDEKKLDSNMEKLYSPSQWCNGRCDPKVVVDEHIKTTSNESEKVRSKYSCMADLRYGTGPRQVLDIFEPLENSGCLNPAPTFVYIHGGYWQLLHKEVSSYCVAPLVKAGIRVSIADYDLAPDVSLKVIVQEIEELVQYLGLKGSSENWGPLWIGGHSAGAHLAISMLCSEVREYISGFVLISGIYDLRPLVFTSVNAALSLTEDEAASLSPLLQIQQLTASNFQGPVIMAVGEYESPAFQQQQKDLSTELMKKEFYVDTNVITQEDHFTIVEQLCHHTYFLTRVIIEAILSKISTSEQLVC